ncbi:Protein MRG1 [Vitis vinifera]|uniref:Protein MRG1 n=1 Tax=Vitis vinifera TaxID=29760 RepID=A0A438FB80_VITVI|nr:Protein MRG1 [Vitis vinifera]
MNEEMVLGDKGGLGMDKGLGSVLMGGEREFESKDLLSISLCVSCMEKCDKPDCKPSKYLLYFVVLLPCSLEVFFPLRGFLCVIEVARGKRRKSDSGIEKDNASTEKLVKIPIPATLKKQLVDDWDFVTQQDKLVKLPRIPNVDAILIKYLEYRIKKDGT